MAYTEITQDVKAQNCQKWRYCENVYSKSDARRPFQLKIVKRQVYSTLSIF